MKLIIFMMLTMNVGDWYITVDDIVIAEVVHPTKPECGLYGNAVINVDENNPVRKIEFMTECIFKDGFD